jgi:hypothetical protein
MERSELVGEKNGTSPLHDFGLLPSKESDTLNFIIMATQTSSTPRKLPACSLGLIWLAESTAGWFFVRVKHCWLVG